jgi:hypothetical protein
MASPNPSEGGAYAEADILKYFKHLESKASPPGRFGGAYEFD